MKDCKPCPFCGRADTQVVINAADYFDQSAVGTTILCDENIGGCGAHCGFVKRVQPAKDRWNARAALEPLK